MKRKLFAIGSILFSLTSLPALAQDPDLPPPPPLEAYMAQPPGPPPAAVRHAKTNDILSRFYITGKAGASFVEVKNITNSSNNEGGMITLPPPVKTTTSATVFTAGGGIGYQFLRTQYFNGNLEAIYLDRRSFNYNASPFLVFGPPQIPSQINSTIKNQTLLFNLVGDFRIPPLHPFIPYLQAGIGAARNRVSSNASIQLAPGSNFVGSGSTSDTDFAWDAGGGVKLEVTKNLLFSLGYEYEDLGTLNWDMNFPNDFDPSTSLKIKLQSNKFYSNTVLFGIIWMPFFLNYATTVCVSC